MLPEVANWFPESRGDAANATASEAVLKSLLGPPPPVPQNSTARGTVAGCLWKGPPAGSPSVLPGDFRSRPSNMDAITRRPGGR